MIKIIKDAMELYLKSTPFIFCTITFKHGSAPREVGATMIVTENGYYSGTIGGGEQEYNVINKAVEFIKNKKSGNEFYEVTKEEAAKNGFVCGGQNRVHFQYVDVNNSKVKDYLELIINYVNENKDVYLVYNLKEDLSISIEVEGVLYPFVVNREFNKEDLFKIKVKKPMKIVIFGGGHIAKAVYGVFDFLGHNIVVVDDREEFITEKDYPNAIRKVIDYENLSVDEIDNGDYVCIMTRGHKYDILALEEALKKNPYYIGVVGNTKKAVIYKDHFKGGQYENLYDRIVHLPVGLSIKALTPEEIAISIAGEVIKSYREDV